MLPGGIGLLVDHIQEDMSLTFQNVVANDIPLGPPMPPCTCTIFNAAYRGHVHLVELLKVETNIALKQPSLFVWLWDQEGTVL